MNDHVRIANWLDASRALHSETVALRRAIHREPELGLSTPRTLAKVREALAGLPLRFKTGPSTTGLIAILDGARPGRTVLLRGDMDALPMPEDTNLDFRSTIDGAMHACGHDAHTAMLATAAKVLCGVRERLAGRVLFMFQPGEEGFHGARHMIDDGLLDDPAPDAAFAIHIAPNAPAGMLSSKAGPLLASADRLKIEVHGRGGHASMPHQALDPIPVACEIVTALQTWVTRQIDAFDPVVVTIGKIDGGSTDNVIPESARLTGTIRSVSEASRTKIHAGVAQLAEHIARAHGAVAKTHVERGFPVTVCDARAVDLAGRAISDLLGPHAWQTMQKPIMGAEDFSYVLQKVPGAMMMLGVCPDGQDWQTACPCHSNRMTLNETVLARGVAAHCAVAERFLTEGLPAG
ncbi:MAG TPA: M20 family metallopeptidase [Pseudomonadales bacterium]|nr:M20 family metallopeptidase [Pseudomonadales bacterium]